MILETIGNNKEDYKAMTKYETLFNAIQRKLDKGEITLEKASMLNDYIYDKYAVVVETAEKDAEPEKVDEEKNPVKKEIKKDETDAQGTEVPEETDTDTTPEKKEIKKKDENSSDDSDEDEPVKKDIEKKNDEDTSDTDDDVDDEPVKKRIKKSSDKSEKDATDKPAKKDIKKKDDDTKDCDCGKDDCPICSAKKAAEAEECCDNKPVDTECALETYNAIHDRDSLKLSIYEACDANIIDRDELNLMLSVLTEGKMPGKVRTPSQKANTPVYGQGAVNDKQQQNAVEKSVDKDLAYVRYIAGKFADGSYDDAVEYMKNDDKFDNICNTAKNLLKKIFNK